MSKTLPPLPEPMEYTPNDHLFSAEQMQAYAIAAIEAQGVPDGMVLVDRGALHMVINALRRDAEDGRKVRGEMADMLASAPPAPQAKPQPLTRDQVKDLCAEAGYEKTPLQARSDFINGIRHAEAAHGIKGE